MSRANGSNGVDDEGRGSGNAASGNSNGANGNSVSNGASGNNNGGGPAGNVNTAGTQISEFREVALVSNGRVRIRDPPLDWRRGRTLPEMPVVLVPDATGNSQSFSRYEAYGRLHVLGLNPDSGPFDQEYRWERSTNLVTDLQAVTVYDPSLGGYVCRLQAGMFAPGAYKYGIAIYHESDPLESRCVFWTHGFLVGLDHNGAHIPHAVVDAVRAMPRDLQAAYLGRPAT